MSDCKIFSPVKSNLGNSDRASCAWLGLVTQLQYTFWFFPRIYCFKNYDERQHCAMAQEKGRVGL